MPVFFCKLITPRPSFAADMTPEERQIMMKHGAYWTAGLEKDGVIAFGPVADPKGFFGMALLDVPSLNDAQKFTAQDPAILSEHGFKYEISQMASFVIRK
jgi:hypothetical protein